MSNRTLQVDWLSLYCKGRPAIVERFDLRFEKVKFGTQHFKDFVRLIDTETNEYIGDMQYNPKTPIIPDDAVIMRFENRQLYKEDWQSLVNETVFKMNFDIKNISRIDICADFQSFANKLLPQNLIKGFVENRYLKVGVKKYALQGEQVYSGGHKYAYLRFGKRDSGVAVYLYNKSLEMREVKNKPYIVETWRKAGFREDRDVWRLEFSVDPSKIKIFGKNNDFELELYKLIQHSLMTERQIAELFDTLVEKYFDFRINDANTRIDRMERVKLFKNIPTETLRVKAVTDHAQSNRMDKILVKKLTNYAKECRLDDRTDADQVDALITAARIYADRNDLTAYQSSIESSKETTKGS